MEKKTFEEICIEQALAYGRKDYRQDFEIGAGVSKLMSEEQFFSRCAEIYANHCAEMDNDEMMCKFAEWISAHSYYQIKKGTWKGIGFNDPSFSTQELLTAFKQSLKQ